MAKKKSAEYHMIYQKGTEHLGPIEVVIGPLSTAVAKVEFYNAKSKSVGRKIPVSFITDKTGKVLAKI
jgi:hypothetical protein